MNSFLVLSVFVINELWTNTPNVFPIISHCTFNVPTPFGTIFFVKVYEVVFIFLQRTNIIYSTLISQCGF